MTREADEREETPAAAGAPRTNPSSGRELDGSPSCSNKDYRTICPNCGTAMHDRGCKTRCPKCGFFTDCSDPW